MYKEIKSLNLQDIDQEILNFWETNKVFEKSIESKKGAENFVFYEGPPSANGKPGIHHVMGRTVKDIFCRYQTLIGKKVFRKGGWDTHGLPIELSVEKELGITKEDIGTKISIDEYNHKCRETVMRFKSEWDDLTRKMGYWVDLNNPYITFENDYIESVWYLLKKIYEKNLLYKGFTIQPYSPAAGTGLSTHELNQPGCYREVKDVSAVALFELQLNPENKNYSFLKEFSPLYCAAWTTTPWTLPSNTALAVGEKIKYCIVETFNPYTKDKNYIILAKDLVSKWFKPEMEWTSTDPLPEPLDKNIKYRIVGLDFLGNSMQDTRYLPLFNYSKPTDGDAFKILIGDFVSTEDGTGIVHIAPSFGADDMRVAKKYGIGSLTLVDRQGKFTSEVTDFAHEYVKEDFLSEEEKHHEKIRLGLDRYLSVDERIVIKLKSEGKLYNAQKYAHNYPHCWRTDKPVLYYPLDSWFIKVTAIKDRLVALNNTINWKPESTGVGRFGHWLENLQDWNLSRSRYWGIPLPIWRNKAGDISKCIGSIEELQNEIAKANKFLNLSQIIPQDLHRPFIDQIILVNEEGNEPLHRELDLIDVWFDSGAMPYAQIHYPFSGIKLSAENFPADFIAEGVDQTRGWFYTLHAISALVFDSVAFKNVVSNGLVLDKNGEKMSKRKGNVIDPFSTLSTYGADATRWYMISNADPWENLKFDLEGITEVRNKFFGTLFNTYNFFAIYANVDQFKFNTEYSIPLDKRPELDQWILSRLQSLIKEYKINMDNYEPTICTRLVEKFVNDDLSNWHVRLSRRRFWKTDSSNEKVSAFNTLYECLVSVSQLIAPFAPFFADWLYKNLKEGSNEKSSTDIISVHLSSLPIPNNNWINLDLERRMNYAQRISSLILSLRKSEKIRVRQPLSRILLPVLDENFKSDILLVEDLIKAEVNIKNIEYISADTGIVKKRAKPNFRTLGKKLGKHMQQASNIISNFDNLQIQNIEQNSFVEIKIEDSFYNINKEDVEIFSEDIPGWLVSSDNDVTVALDINLNEELLLEGTAREIINRIQNIRKLRDYNITDRILIKLESHPEVIKVIYAYKEMICNEVLADELEVSEDNFNDKMELNDNLTISFEITLSKN